MIEKDALELTQEERLRQDTEILRSLAKQIDGAIDRDDMVAARRLAERGHRVRMAMPELGRNLTWDIWFSLEEKPVDDGKPCACGKNTERSPARLSGPRQAARGT